MKRTLSLLAALTLAGLLLAHPDRAALAVSEALSLCARSVVPSLFPFFVVVPLLLELGLASRLQRPFAVVMGPVFSLSGACALPLLAGLVGGYPTGAKTAAELCRRGDISRDEAARLLAFCNNCGPGFILGYAASVLGSAAMGWRLWAIHAVSALLTGLLLCRGRGRGAPRSLPTRLPAPVRTFPAALTEAAAQAVQSTLGVCGWVVTFRVLLALLPVPGWSAGVLELVSGVSALSPGRGGFTAAAALLGWGGLSVHCQTMSAAEGIPMSLHLRGKLTQAALSALLAWLSYPK